MEQQQQLSTINPSLIRKLICLNNPNQSIDKDAVDAVGELIRQFIIETHHRAMIEAEFENDMMKNKERQTITRTSSKNINHKNDSNNIDDHDDDDQDKDATSSSILSKKRKRERQFLNDNNDDTSTFENNEIKIHPEHILKVSAGILMDFS